MKLSQSSFWKRVFFILLANFLFLMICLYSFEWIHHAPYNGLKKSEDNAEYSWGIPITYNKDGFRDRELVPKQKGVYRVMVIGDSFTFGVGIQTQQRYSDQLEALLRTHYPAQSIEVLNLSAGGNSTATERDLLRKYQDRVDPNLIIVGFCLNDLEMGLYNKDWTRFQIRYSAYIDKMTRVFAQVGLRFTGMFVRDCVYKLAQVLHIIPMWDAALDQIYQRGTPEWDNYIQALRDIKSMSDARKLPSPVLLILNQSAGRWGADADYAAPSPRLKRVLRMFRLAEEGAKEVGFVTINYEHEFATELKGSSLRLNAYDAHPSAAMHAMYAKKLFETVFKNGLPH